MHIFKRRIPAAVIVSVILTVAAPAAYAQQVHIVPHPGHPSPHAIYLASSKLSVEIRAGVAHTTLTQIFANPNDWQAEGIYLFPLPEGAAVTDFRLTMDGQSVRGEVLDREKARNIYMDIVRRIRDPALLEWINHRVFQARIFPFDPRGERTLTLSYAQVLPQEGDYRVFRYLTGQGRMEGPPPTPMIREIEIQPDMRRVDPRNPAISTEQAVRQRGRLTSFVIEGMIKEDMPIHAVYSPTHPLSVEHEQEGTLARFSAEGSLRSREGFTLYYGTGEQRDIGMSLLANRPPGEDGYFLLTITPGQLRSRGSMPRDVIFVLDTSGSMRGDRKLEQAVEALEYGLSTLGSEDRFALVIYNSTVMAWRDELATAGRATVSEARDFIKGLSAGGGTNIEGALAAAADFAMESVENNGARSHLTYVVFLTDGLATVGEENPQELLDQSSRDMPEEARLFTWGVGYDVNAFLLDSLAGEHGGQSAYVEPTEDLEVKVSAFFKSVSTPVLADLVFNIAGAGAYDLFPAKLPDLFEGTHVTIMGRFRNDGRVELRLAGTMGDREHRVRRSVNLPRRESEASFLAPMWAQRKVGFLLEQIRLRGESEELKSEIVELGERYGIVTPYTAYLVIEEHMHRAEMEGLDFAAPADQAARRMAREAIAASARPDASLYGGRAGSQKQTGEADIQLSIAERNLQTATAWQQASYLKVQRVEEKTFQLDEDSGIWKDQTIRSDQRIIEVEIGSDEFVRLLRQHESLARYAAMGEQVEVQLGNQAYRLVLK